MGMLAHRHDWLGQMSGMALFIEIMGGQPISCGLPCSESIPFRVVQEIRRLSVLNVSSTQFFSVAFFGLQKDNQNLFRELKSELIGMDRRKPPEFSVVIPWGQ